MHSCIDSQLHLFQPQLEGLRGKKYAAIYQQRVTSSVSYLLAYVVASEKPDATSLLLRGVPPFNQ